MQASIPMLEILRRSGPATPSNLEMLDHRFNVRRVAEPAVALELFEVPRSQIIPANLGDKGVPDKDVGVIQRAPVCLAPRENLFVPPGDRLGKPSRVIELARICELDCALFRREPLDGERHHFLGVSASELLLDMSAMSLNGLDAQVQGVSNLAR